MIKRILSILLVFLMTVSFFPLTALAEESIMVTYSWLEGFVYVGGIYDIRVQAIGTNADKATYRWQADASMGDGSWYDLDDNHAWHGTKTNHLQLYTNEGVLYGTGWEDIPFRCLVTVDGKEYASPDCYMQVMPQWMMLRDLKENNEGFLEPNGVGLGGYEKILSATEEGYPSKATAVAGKELSFSISHTDPSAMLLSTLSRSEVSFVPEIKVYEKGKLVQSGSESCTYIPQTVGSTLTVEHILRVKAGETDHGVYQSNKMTIDVLAPAVIGKGIVKKDCSLLKERYTQAQKLASIPKGSNVQLVENSGGTWYKVIYNNTVGYLPADALNTKQQITDVRVTMDTPSAGQQAPSVIAVNGQGYRFSSIGWWDMKENRYLKQGEFLKNDRQYRASIWLEAEKGYEFAVNEQNDSLVKGFINNSSVEISEAFEKDVREVIVLNTLYAPTMAESHSCLVKIVPAVAPGCTTAGHEAYYRCGCGKTYSDLLATKPCDPNVDGILPAMGHKPSAWKYNGTHHYRKCDRCKEIIAGTTAAHVGDSVCKTCGYELHQCSPRAVRMIDPTCQKDGFEAYYLCDCGKTYKDKKATQEVNLNEWGLIPKLPHSPGNWKYNGTHHYRKCEYCYEIIAGTTAAHSGDPVCTVCGFETHKCSPKLVNMVDPTCQKDGFEAYYRCDCGKTYKDKKATQEVNLNEWGLIPKLPHYPGNWKYNGTHHYRKCEYCLEIIVGTTAAHSENPCLVCGYVNPNAKRKVTSIAISDVASPVAGMNPDYMFTLSGSGYALNQNSQAYEGMYRGAAWYDITDQKYLSNNNVFQLGHEYQLYLSLMPNDGYVFEYPDGSVNGKSAETFGSEYDITICYTFPPCQGRSTTGSRPIRGN